MNNNAKVISFAGVRKRLLQAARAQGPEHSRRGQRRTKGLTKFTRLSTLILLPPFAGTAVLRETAWAMWVLREDAAALLGRDGPIWIWVGYALLDGALHRVVWIVAPLAVAAVWGFVLYMIGVHGLAHASFTPSLSRRWSPSCSAARASCDRAQNV